MSDRLTPILAAARAKIAALNPSVGGEALPVLVRRAAHRRQTMDPKRMITVAKSATPEQTTRRRFGLWQTEYVIDVVLHAPYAGPDDAADELLALRDRIVDSFKAVPLAGAPAVFEMDCQPADWMRPTGEASEWDWFACQITATVAHE